MSLPDASHLRQLRTIYRLSASVARAAELEEISGAAMEGLIDAVGADRVSVLLFDDDDVMRFKAWRGLSEAYRRAVEGHTPWTPDDTEAVPIAVGDVGADPSMSDVRETVLGEGIRALAFIPLISGGRVLGKFMVYFDQPHEFTETELQLCQIIAAHVAYVIERKQAEEALRRRAEETETLLDTLPIGVVFAHDAECRRITGNRAGHELLRISMGSNLSKSAPAGEQPTHFRIYRNGSELEADQLPVQRAARGEQIRDEELEHVFEDGSVLNLLISAASLRDRQGRPRGAVASVLDITQRTSVEQALRESEERYRAVVESQAEMLCRFRPDGTILFVNGAYARARGMTPEALRGRNFWDFISEEDRAAVRGLLDRLTPDSPEVCIENRFETTEGERWTLWTNRALSFDDDGRPMEAQSSGIDITDRKRAELALREREERYELVVAGAEAAIWDWDIPAKRVLFSPRWKELRGLSDDEVSDRDEEWSRRIHPDDYERVMTAVRAHFEGKTEVFAEEYRVRHKDGHWRWILDRGLARRDETGRVIRMAGSETDITKRKQAEEALRKLNEQLEQRVAERTAELERQNQRLRELASQLTEVEQRERHRLAKTLHDGLQHILIAAKMQLPLYRGDRALELGQHLGKLLDEAIDASRSLSYDLSPPALYGSELPDAIGWLADWFRKHHGFEVELQVADDFPLLPDPTRMFLFGAVRELLLNSVKHSGSRAAQIDIRTPQAGEAAITVADLGQGFDPMKLEWTGGESHGLGLFSIRERLAALGGSFHIESTPGAGARFILIVPVPRDQERGERLEAAAWTGVPAYDAGSNAKRKGPIRVMIVDDHVMVREGLSSLLKEENDMEVVAEACDGEEAIVRAEELRPDVLVMDIEMPRIDGIEATRRIKQKQPEILVIGLSFHEERDKIEKMHRAGASAYLRKGGSAEILFKTIRDLCGGLVS